MSSHKNTRTCRATAALLTGLAGLLMAPAFAGSNEAATSSQATAIASAVTANLQSGHADVTGSLLFVGPARVDSDADGTWVTVLGQVAGISIETAFPRGQVAPGDYVAVTGELSPDGPATATAVIRLGGSYSAGNSAVYLRGAVASLTTNGLATINQTRIDLAQGYGGNRMSELAPGDVIEILGFEAQDSHGESLIVATSASNLVDGSGVRGIHGSGLRSADDSSVLGIHGSGVRGIHGSGLRSTDDSNVLGIHGSGVRGIHGSGLRSTDDSNVLGIHGSGVRGIHGSGLRSTDDSNVLGIHGSGVRGIHGSGIRATNSSDTQ
ncbi:MAG: hypothetical protein IT484_06780 [Gammaproteobacteria bacterium]|nr:hypothetical protein [Gammaproteobacteria bacterium]